MNTSLLQIVPHGSKALSDIARRTPGAVDLTIGVPDYGPPAQFFVQSEILMQDARSKEWLNRYCNSAGLPSLRDALVQRYMDRYELELSRQNIVVTNGGAEAIFLGILTCTNPGDEIIIPDPAYVLYEPITKILGRIPIRLPLNEFGDLMIEGLNTLVNKKTSMIIINSPENPTGKVYSLAELEALVNWSEERKIYLLHDEVFDDTVFEGEHRPISYFSEKCDWLLLVNSFSKRYGMTGWRVGWLVAPERISNEATKARTFMNLAMPTMVQESLALSLIHI